MKLLTKLEKVKKGHSLNWPSFYKHLLRQGISDILINEAMSVTRYSDKVYGVTITNRAAFKKIEALSQPVVKESRAMASRSGNTHAVSVNGALLITMTEHSKDPCTYIFTKDKPLPIPRQNHAVIIENLECFLNFKTIYQFMTQYCSISREIVRIEDIEFIYAAGNSISNYLIVPYLQQFSGEIFCLFDIDIGGLQIYRNLLNNGLDLIHTHFVIPDDVVDRLEQSRRKATKAELAKLNKFLHISNQIDQLIVLIHHYQTTIEQESYRV